MMRLTALVAARWAALAPRERRVAAGALALVALVLLWWMALAPALRTLAAAPAEHALLDAQLQRMTTLQAQAGVLRSQPRANHDDALRALESSVRQSLGTNAQLRTAGGTEGASITLRAAAADALAPWLAQARSNAHAVPREAHLTRAQAGGPAASPATGGPGNELPAKVRWDGTLVMSLPPGG